MVRLADFAPCVDPDLTSIHTREDWERFLTTPNPVYVCRDDTAKP